MIIIKGSFFFFFRTYSTPGIVLSSFYTLTNLIQYHHLLKYSVILRMTNLRRSEVSYFPKVM